MIFPVHHRVFVRRRDVFAGGAALLAGLAYATGVRANGDEFFVAGQALGDTELVYVGTVKDVDGKYVKGAVVRWEAPAEEGAHNVGFETYTNEFGRYRTVNVARALAALDVPINPDLINVTARKDGYTFVRRLHRGTTARKMGVVEVNFTLARSPAIPAAK